MAERSRLLSGYGVLSSVQGSNPCVSASGEPRMSPRPAPRGQPSTPDACFLIEVRETLSIDEELLRSVYEQCYRPMVRMCALMIGDTATAEDIVQDVFMRGAARIAQLVPDAVVPYLRRVVANE